MADIQPEEVLIMTRNVAVGLDGTPESLAAAEWAAREALLRRCSCTSFT